jgi:hypothetical protein
MSVYRILALVAVLFAFVLMLSSVTASSDFVYAPESTWKTSVDQGQDEAIAAWRSARSVSATASSAHPDDGARRSSVASVSVSSSATASSVAPVSSVTSSASSSSTSVGGGVLPDWMQDWWTNDDASSSSVPSAPHDEHKGKDRKGH